MSDNSHHAIDSSIPAATAPTTTTSVAVIPNQVQVRSPYLEYESLLFFAGGIWMIIMGIGSLLGFIEKVQGWLDRKKKRGQEDDQPFDARLTSLETQVKTFRTKEELDEAFADVNERIDHEKDNRRTIQEGQESRLRMVIDNQASDRVIMAEVRTNVNAMMTNHQRVEDSVENLRARVDERFDRLQDLLIGKK